MTGCYIMNDVAQLRLNSHGRSGPGSTLSSGKQGHISVFDDMLRLCFDCMQIRECHVPAISGYL